MTLLDKLSASKEGSRALDAEIQMLVTPHAEMDPNCESFHLPEVEAHGFETPYYTTSLDAALTLVPEGWFVVSLGQFWEKAPRPKPWHVSLMDDDTGDVSGDALTAALCVCIAALRARSAMP